MTAVALVVDNVEYWLEVSHYRPPEAPSRWNPGVGSEIELASTLLVFRYGDAAKRVNSLYGNAPGCWPRDVVPLNYFILLYAAYHNFTLDQAREDVYTKMTDYADEDYRERRIRWDD
jgi:hypothetical protein